jgi:Terpene synthase family 2, C-terminal metal binding
MPTGTMAPSLRKLPMSESPAFVILRSPLISRPPYLRFRERFVRLAGPNNIRRFAELCDSYTDCVAKEAELRERGEVLGLEDFIALRRQNSAVLLCYSLVEYILGIDLPDSVFDDPGFSKAYWAACDFVCWANVSARSPPDSRAPDFFTDPCFIPGQDVYSYDMEQAKGHTGNNVVTVLMKEKGLGLQEAAEFVGQRCELQMSEYLEGLNELSPDLPPAAISYIKALGHWMVGNLV